MKNIRLLLAANANCIAFCGTNGYNKEKGKVAAIWQYEVQM